MRKGQPAESDPCTGRSPRVTKVGSEPLRSLEGEAGGMRSVQRAELYEAIDFTDDVSDEARLRRSRELGKELGF